MKHIRQNLSCCGDTPKQLRATWDGQTLSAFCNGVRCSASRSIPSSLWGVPPHKQGHLMRACLPSPMLHAPEEALRRDKVKAAPCLKDKLFFSDTSQRRRSCILSEPWRGSTALTPVEAKAMHFLSCTHGHSSVGKSDRQCDLAVNSFMLTACHKRAELPGSPEVPRFSASNLPGSRRLSALLESAV